MVKWDINIYASHIRTYQIEIVSDIRYGFKKKWYPKPIGFPIQSYQCSANDCEIPGTLWRALIEKWSFTILRGNLLLYLCWDDYIYIYLSIHPSIYLYLYLYLYLYTVSINIYIYIYMMTIYLLQWRSTTSWSLAVLNLNRNRAHQSERQGVTGFCLPNMGSIETI